MPHPNLPRSLISVPLGGLLCRYGLAPGISVILRNSREPPGSGKEAGESPKSILPLVTQLHILFTLQRGVRVSSSTKGTISLSGNFFSIQSSLANSQCHGCTCPLLQRPLHTAHYPSAISHWRESPEPYPGVGVGVLRLPSAASCSRISSSFFLGAGGQRLSWDSM